MSKVIDIKTRKPVEPAPSVQQCTCGWQMPRILNINLRSEQAPIGSGEVVNPPPGSVLQVNFACPQCGACASWGTRGQ